MLYKTVYVVHYGHGQVAISQHYLALFYQSSGAPRHASRQAVCVLYNHVTIATVGQIGTPPAPCYQPPFLDTNISVYLILSCSQIPLGPTVSVCGSHWVLSGEYSDIGISPQRLYCSSFEYLAVGNL